jgi:hypothetical protein
MTQQSAPDARDAAVRSFVIRVDKRDPAHHE